MRRDYYAVLGVAATAPPREIRQAYRRLARQYSPDVNFWDTTARTLFEEIAEAFRILSDPDARTLYDRFGARPDALAAGRRGDDVHVAVELGFSDVVRGTTVRSEEHTSELQSLAYLVCRLLLEKKKKNIECVS